METVYFVISIAFAIALAIVALVIALVGGLAFIRIAQSAVKATREFADSNTEFGTIKREFGVMKSEFDNLRKEVTTTSDELKSDVHNFGKNVDELAKVLGVDHKNRRGKKGEGDE